MPNFEQPNDAVSVITILVRDAAGEIVAAPEGDVFSATSSEPNSLSVAVNVDRNGAPAIVLTPLVQVSAGITITVTDSAGLIPFEQVVDIVQDVRPKTLDLDVVNVEETAQPVPANPGP